MAEEKKELFDRVLLRGLHARATAWTGVSTLVILTGGSFLVWLAERHAPGGTIRTLPNALWWAAETATTIGYGDMYPVTLAGRLIATLVMLAGISMFSVVTATFATWFVTRERRQRPRIDEAELEREEAELLTKIRSFRATLDQMERVISTRAQSAKGKRRPRQ